MSSGKISVIIPVYNSGKYLKQCVDSVLNQSYQDVEILLIDNGSTDNSIDILNEYRKNPKCIVLSEEKKGVSFARNLGLRNATGDYITFVDSDDIVGNEIYSQSVSALNTYDCDMCFFRYKEIISDDEVVNSSEPENHCILSSSDLYNNTFTGYFVDGYV